jgi:2-dehydro-3-deoxygluconokinase
MAGDPERFDVITVGEILVEVFTEQPVAHGIDAVLGISGDALNVAASAAAAGARVAIVAVLPDDEIGDAISRRVAELGISTELLRHRAGQQGIYIVHGDPQGQRHFAYARQESVGSTLGPADLDGDAIRRAGYVVSSGITAAISTSARDALFTVAASADRFVFDPNFRPRLATAESAAADLSQLTKHAYLVAPSFPTETSALLGVDSAAAAGESLIAQGAEVVVVTCGDKGVLLATPDGSEWLDSFRAPSVVDQTGAGDAFIGTMIARLALRDSLVDATRCGAAAAALVVGGRGGTGFIPSLDQTRRLAGLYGVAGSDAG